MGLTKFLFVGKGLSSMLKKAEAADLLKGVKASRSGSDVSHFFLINDFFMMGH